MNEGLTIMNEGFIINETHYFMDVLLMFEVSYYLRMREGVECGGSPWLRMRGCFIILAARQTNSVEYELEFALI